jgi:uncharacterized phage protein (predicted DNA packaging)
MILDDVKLALRISSSTIAFDIDINDLIEEARQDLILSGITSEKAQDDADILIKRAIKTYAKANFGWDNPDAERLQKSYDLLKNHLSLAQDYNAYTITFTVTSGLVLIEDAFVTFNGETKTTNSLGVTKFTGVNAAQNMDYLVSKEGYQDYKRTIDVESSQSISVSLVVN